MAGVFVAKGKDGVRVAITGAGDGGVYRHKGLEAALDKKFDSASIDGVKVDSKGLMSDMHATADYRAALIKVMAKRSVVAAG
jgi:carbon-monoxide dehydrogenase medium subunit